MSDPKRNNPAKLTFAEHSQHRHFGSQSQLGVALIMVIFVIALATILVVNLTHSTFIEAQLNTNIERSLKAEYLLKSSINIARQLIVNDGRPADSFKDDWGQFKDGLSLPVSELGIDEPNVRVQLEIRPEGGKINLNALRQLTLGSSDTKWRDILTRLFQSPVLDFDNDEEPDHSGHFPGKIFKAKDLVAALIDYMSASKEPYQDGDYRGIKSPGNDLGFPPDGGPIKRLAELSSIPGFTPRRMQLLMPLVTVSGQVGQININVADAAVLTALHPDMTPALVEEIRSFANGEQGPFTRSELTSQLSAIIGESLQRDIFSMVTTLDSYFQVISKVDYGTATYFMRAYLYKGPAGQLAEIKSIELFN